MNLNIDPEWLKRMAEIEGNGIVSVGGLVSKMSGMTLEERLKDNKGADRNCRQCLIHLDPEDIVFTWDGDEDGTYCSVVCRTQEILDTEARNDPKFD